MDAGSSGLRGGPEQETETEGALRVARTEAGGERKLGDTVAEGKSREQGADLCGVQMELVAD